MCKQKEMEVKVLSSMINIKRDVLGDKKFNALNYGFYDFFDKSLMKKEEYEEIMKKLNEILEILQDKNKKGEYDKTYYENKEKFKQKNK